RQDQYRVGVRLSDSRNMAVSGNVFANVGTGNGMTNLASVIDSANLVIGPNESSSVPGSILYEGTNNTGISGVYTTPPSTITLTANAGFNSADITARQVGGVASLSIRFAVASGTASGTTIATLPPEYRPTYGVKSHLTTSGGDTMHLNISQSGTITPVFSST